MRSARVSRRDPVFGRPSPFIRRAPITGRNAVPRDARYDVLFEPVKIGPVTARNRVYPVPHCTGMGHSMPRSLAAMREVKAEGGLGVVCTEYCSIHPSCEDTPYAFASPWDEDDVKNQALVCEAVHSHEALAGVELYSGRGEGYAEEFAFEYESVVRERYLRAFDMG